MPWIPDLFNARYVADLSQRHGVDHIAAVPYFDGILAEQPDALAASFAGEPELHHPIRGRVKGTAAFTRVVQSNAEWLRRSNYTVEPVDLIATDHRTIEEVVLSFDDDRGRVALPLAIVTDRGPGGLRELRIYFSTWPLTGEHAIRPPWRAGLGPRLDGSDRRLCMPSTCSSE